MRRVVLMAVLVATGASAQTIYRWTDPRGTVHYTDDATTIPAGAKVTTTEGEEISNTGTPQKVTAPAPAPAAANNVQPAPAPTAVDTGEAYWRGEFRTARDKIRSLEDELLADQRLFSDYLPMTGTYYCPSSYVWGRPRVAAVQQEQVSLNGSVNVPLGTAGTLNVNGQVTSGFRRNTGIIPYTGYGGCWYAQDGEYQRTQERIAQTQRTLARAKEDLTDLERRAANYAVPLEWRH